MPHRLLPLTSVGLGLLLLTGWPTVSHAEVVTREVRYEHQGEQFVGYLAYDAAVQGARPGVLVIHEWWGLNDYPKRRARELAGLGYTAFAADLYGQGQSTADPAQAGQWAATLGGDRELLRQRAGAALAALREQPEVDAERLAAVGYCFGGTAALELAWSGADLDAVVSFHGNPRLVEADDEQRLRASVLICHGAADKNVPATAITAVTDSLTRAEADWMLIVYADAPHAFTNPDADRLGMDGVGYNATADRRSWQHMKLFLEETLAK